MRRMLNQLISLLEDELLLFLSISLGVFLFVLFLRPFPFDNFDSHYPVILALFHGTIVFLSMFLARIFIPCLMGRISQSENEITLSPYVSGFIIWVLSSFAFIWYLKYVGFISISADVVFKVIIIFAVPSVILMASDSMRKLKMENKSLISEKGKTQNQLFDNQEDYMNFSIDFISGPNGGKLSFILGKILFLKSANNYIEIHYLKEGQIKKKLIRNTLTNVELQIESYPTFIRCHRTCIVNTHFIEKINGNCNHRTLTISGYKNQIPVSRQYYLKVKEAV